MKIHRAVIGAVVLGFPLLAAALKPSTGVRTTPLLETTKSWDGKPIVYPKGTAKITGFLIEIAPGAETGWHTHPVPSFGMILEGTLIVALKDGRVKRLQAGDALAEVVNTAHNGRNAGEIPVKLVVFYTGIAGKALTIKEPQGQDSHRRKRP